MQASKISFIYFHYGGTPSYLKASIESVRRFHPQSRIFLICDSSPRFPLEWNITVFDLEEFTSPALKDFRKAYRHISVFPEKYERFVLERWFLAEEMRKKLTLGPTIVLDSDMMVFQSVLPLFSQLPDKDVSMCGWSPHFSFVLRTVQGFLDHIMMRYADDEYLKKGRETFEKAIAAKGLRNLGEMEFVLEYMAKGESGAPYERRFAQGYVDTNIHVPDGFDAIKLRRRERKIVLWHFENGDYVPYLRETATKDLIPAVALHFQGPSKRLIRRFNRLGKPSILPPSLRCKLLNLLFNRGKAG